MCSMQHLLWQSCFQRWASYGWHHDDHWQKYHGDDIQCNALNLGCEALGLSESYEVI